MNKLNFVTSNLGKIKTLENSLKLYGLDIAVYPRNLEIIEPQFDSVHEISRYKALKAFELLGEPILVEDGGLSIFSLKGFPGVYTKYVMKTLGIGYILKLLDGVENRTAKFVSVTTFVNNEGKVFQFENEGFEFLISHEIVDIDSPFAWSELWKIMYLKEYKKNLCQMSEKELFDYYEKAGKNGSIQKFTKWYLITHNA